MNPLCQSEPAPLLMGDPASALKLDFDSLTLEELEIHVENLRERRLVDGVEYRRSKIKTKNPSQAGTRTRKPKIDPMIELEGLAKQLGLNLTDPQMLALANLKKKKKVVKK